jgi:hypothetical protein
MDVIARMCNMKFAVYMLGNKDRYVVQFSNTESSGWAESNDLGVAVVVAALHAIKVPDLENHAED